MSEALFDLPPGAIVPVAEPEKLSATRRLTLRQRRDVAAGRHPLTGGPLHPDDRRRCGNCSFRRLTETNGNRRWPKCWLVLGLITHGPATDVRAWWPACRGHEWGDPKLSPDAARSGPPS